MTAVFADITLRLFLLNFFCSSSALSFKHTHTSHDCQQVSFICFCQSRITLPSVPSSYSCPGDCICNFSHLQIIFCAILVTAFPFFRICRLSPRYTCDRIHNFSHLQIISPTIFVTAFAIFPIYRLSPLQTNDRIRNFSYLKIIFCATPPLRLCLGMLTDRIIPCMDNEYSRGLRHEMQASFRHQAHCLSDSEFGRLADNRRMQRVANAAVLQVHTRGISLP